MCNCNDKPRETQRVASEDPKVIGRNLAKIGTKLLHDLPSDRDCAKMTNASARVFLTALRNIALDASQANIWSEKELESFATSMALADSVAEAVLSVAFAAKDDGNGNGNGGGQSCTFRCKAEKDKCLRKCAGIGWPCFCCADCRLTGLACLADCILSVHSGSDTVFA